MCEERDDGVYGAAAEGVIAQVDLDECGFGFEGVADGGESLGDLVDQAAGEDVCKVGDLCVATHKRRG